MIDITKTSLSDLIELLRKNDRERNNLETEYNLIIEELWNRIPTLKEDEVFQKIGKGKGK